MRIFLATGTILSLLLSAGCSDKLSRQTGLTDADLLARGQKKAEQKKHKDAAEAFQTLIERFPTSPLASRAQFALAESRMANREEIEAEVAFDDFLRLYPADPKVPDALFLKGKLLSGQLLPPGRDQGKTQEALKAYSQFLEKAPGSPRAAEAGKRIAELRNRLALHEGAVIDHFLSRKRFDSAEARALRALEAYPDVPATPDLMLLLSRALDRQGKKEEAAKVRSTLAAKYPGRGGGKR
ncbi:MAG: outer membrane protein assembly factor BamD [Deltaproteobacteria bacterium]|nr:outer membrane protein assembly factor BamD [Deltaproteobacteria bacterium]